MTDKEIIKALESKKEEMICAVVDENRKTHFITNEVVLDLINRQQAEIERLSRSAKQWEETAKDLLMSKEKQQAEIERLQGLLDGWKTEAYKLSDSIDNIKSEAIKEFAEELRREFPIKPMGYSGIGSMYSADGIRSKIKNLVKEMTEPSLLDKKNRR